MNTVKNIVKNAGFLVLGNLVVKILTLFVSVSLARFLGVEDFGEYNFAIAYLSLFIFIANFGLDPILIKTISRNDSNVDYFTSNVMMIRVITSILSIMLAIFIITVLEYPVSSTYYISVLSIILFFQGISYLLESLCYAKLKMRYSTISMIISKLFYSIAAIVAIYFNRNLIDFFYLYIIAEILRTLIDFYYSRLFVKFKLIIDIKLWHSLLKEALPFIAGYALFIIYYRIDILMLSKMTGIFSVGLYSSAYKLLDPILFIPSAIASTLLPIMSKEYGKNIAKLNDVYLKAFKYIFLLMLPLSIFLFLNSRYIIMFLYDASYYPAIFTFMVLSLTLIFNSVAVIQNSLLVATDRQKINTISIGIGCVFNVLLNLLLIPMYSYNGAAIATLFSVIILFMLQFFMIMHKQKFSYRDFDINGILLSTLIVSLISYSIKSYHLVVLIVVYITAYILFLYIFKSISIDELKIIKSMFIRK